MRGEWLELCVYVCEGSFAPRCVHEASVRGMVYCVMEVLYTCTCMYGIERTSEHP